MPDKYAVELPIEKIVCDENVDDDYVQRLAEMDVSKLKPIVVIKHPDKELYAVLDGHHRLKAARLSGLKTIKAAVVDDYVGLGFEFTRQGVFQPSAEFTRYVRLPLKRFMEYMHDFLVDPEKCDELLYNRPTYTRG
jgi:hypothetical protein